MEAEAVRDTQRSWLKRNGWKAGVLLAAAIGGYWWHRSHRHRRFTVGAVSERWLAEQAFEAGQRPEE